MRQRLVIAALFSFVVGLLAAILVAWVALDHNPQGEFFDAERGGVVVDALFPLMLGAMIWFSGPTFVVIGGFVWLVEKTRDRQVAKPVRPGN